MVKTPANMVERGQAMKDLQFKEFMDPTEHFKVSEIMKLNAVVGVECSG